MSAQINFLKNNNGLGIVEVLVAVGLVAIVSVGIMAMISNANKSQRGIQGKDMQREVIAEIRTLLNNRTACLNSFGGGNPSAPFTRASIKDSANVDRFVVGTNDKSNLLRYTEFQIEDWIPDAGYTTQGNVSLSIALTKEGDVSGALLIKQKITLKIKRVALGGITECFSIGTNSDGLWQVSPANPSNIYYSAGNVGIGMDSPNWPFTVGSSVEVNAFGVSSSGDIIVTGGSDRNWALYKTDAAGAPQAVLTVNPNNTDLSISAKLNVAGEIKVGNTLSACNAANEGQQRYNAVIKNMEFCNGIIWTGFGTSLTQTVCLWTGWADWTGNNVCPVGYYTAGQQQRDCGNWHDCERLYCCRSF